MHEKITTLMDYVEWSRGAVIGRGSFSTVSLGYVHRGRDGQHRQQTPVVAVKSAPLAQSALLSHENSVLLDLQGCPHVVRCFGDEVAVDAATGAESYNLFLEYVAGGSLHDVVRRSCGGSLPEPTVRRYARSILQGLRFVHAQGYAHCDIKPQNILVQRDGGGVKIADFGLAKKIGDAAASGDASMRGTPLYMSPESATRSEHGAAADVWSVGCVVAEMASGRPPWKCSGEGGVWELVVRIGHGDEVPEIPSELSEEGKDFLRWCFVKDPAKRWTAEMLLQHPFMEIEDEQVEASAINDLNGCSSMKTSPRSVVFGLCRWVSPTSASWNSIVNASTAFESVEGGTTDSSALPSPADRIKELATTQWPNWSYDGWI
ncbi:mitogen-activated protein kinase kinase kinase YODA-like [Canna indica]|uniref:Mitogen-activated protein kinase kinase kinase YODA-like n=1 Tax=Canna indica TaxID=4628 RepID=A0AAQ3KZ90_9LILI|nr:mitogen-activated protein kinase kinase kinase YODA-like [Canna indica]